MSTVAQNITNIIQAYNQAARGGAAPEAAPTDAARTQQGEFLSLVRGAIREAEQMGVKGEQLSVKGLNNEADLHRVVTAVAEAEMTLRTVVSVRDRVIDAYKEVLRMPI